MNREAERQAVWTGRQRDRRQGQGGSVDTGRQRDSRCTETGEQEGQNKSKSVWKYRWRRGQERNIQEGQR